MKNIFLITGLLTIATATGFLNPTPNKPLVQSAEITAGENSGGMQPTNLAKSETREFSTAPSSPLALKTADFCAGHKKNKNHDKFLRDLSKSLDPKGSYDKVVRDIFNAEVICDNADVFKMTGTWKKLEKEVMAPQSFVDGKAFYLKNKKAFDSAHKKYGVDPSAILGILRIETNFGQNFGEYPLVLHMYNRYFHVDKKSAIARLSVWLPMAIEFSWDPYSGGSYAGAFGFPQFMPQPESLYYSADGDGDGKINLFSEADAIHSVARYFAEHGWGKKTNQKVVMRYNHSSEYAKIVLKYRDAMKPVLAK